MAYRNDPKVKIFDIEDCFPEGLECDYSDPVLDRSLIEHLKTYWLIRRLYDYGVGYEANKVKEVLEPAKFTDRDWLCIAKVCGFRPSWGIQQMENIADERGAAA